MTRNKKQVPCPRCDRPARYRAQIDGWLCDICWEDHVNMKLDEAWSFDNEAK